MQSVPVVYDDGMMDKVDALSLQILIEEQMIVKFQRGKGWAYVGVDPIRKSQRDDYSGPERRQTHLSL
ncbi:MAG TPA: hypothetical protein VKN62_08425 [Pelovirga sp.]|nr:hypothetical protein [Pelovirga sp.]